MTCKDCFHYQVCGSFGFVLDPLHGGVTCCDFKTKADVVEVVRCKDCTFSREMDKYEKQLYFDTCVGCTKHSESYHSLIMDGDDFCSYGERKEGAEE